MSRAAFNAGGVEVLIVDGAIGAESPAPVRATVGATDGAVLVFEGVVRGTEDGRTIDGLLYTAYEPMAQRQLEFIALGLLESLEITSVRVVHSRGLVPVGGVSLRCVVTAPHRRAALEALDRLIDGLKRDVPIWKSVR
ncbi:MAG: molybdenum cofactor biosynthesis protein MoaE [Phycisphaerales bacterium]|nr:molybdenum cofactor biosynthesis protein MoaE [Phycisphaerales bacterium]